MGSEASDHPTRSLAPSPRDHVQRNGLFLRHLHRERSRQREVGVRLAMGASRGQILSHFLVQGLRVTLAGCVAGLLLSAGAGHVLAGMLYEV